MAERELLLDIPLEHEMNILGQMDQNLNKIQKQFQVSIIDRDGLLKIIGKEALPLLYLQRLLPL